MKKSIKYAGIAAATLLAVAPVAAPALSTVTTTQAAATAAQNQAVTAAKFALNSAKLNLTNARKDAVTAADKSAADKSAAQKAVDDALAKVTAAQGTLAAAQKAVADANNSNSDQSDVDKAITDFANQFGDQDVADVKLANNNGLGEDNAESITDFQSNATKSNLIKTATTDKLALLNGTNQDAQVYYTITDAKGNLYDGGVNGGTYDQFNTATKDDNYLPAKVNVYMKYKNLSDSKYGSYTSVAKFNITASSSDNELKTVNAKFTTPLNVAKNSKTAPTQLVNAANVSILDQDGNSLATQAVTIPGAYYYTYSAAMDSASKTAAVNGVGNVKAADISLNDNGSTNEFKTAGTYYQTVTYTAKANSDLATLLSKFTTDPDSYTVLVNGKKASAGYDFVTAGESITFVRAINVSDSEAQWTESASDGVVTTKSDKAYYTLNNNEGNQIKNRALAKNTAWKTDKVRTDQNGNIQYRVATGEWIDANDVTFGDTATTDTGALTDIQSVKGVVKLDNAGFTYFLYNKAGDQLKTRALAGNSSWQVINTAKDSEGNTYYRVATDEWVMQGNGVTFN